MRNFAVTLVSLLLGAPFAGGVVAMRTPQTVTQADGRVLTISKVGDEFLHFTLNSDGEIVTPGSDGCYYMARVDSLGCVTPTGVSALGSAAERRRVAVTPAHLPTARMHSLRQASRLGASAMPSYGVELRQATAGANPYAGLGRFTGNFPRTGDIRACVILVEYPDCPFNVDEPADYFDDMLNGENFTGYGATGSARSYFLNSSLSKFRPTFDVLGPVTLPYGRAYYGGNDSKGNDLQPEDMLVHAVQMLDESVDFSAYDMDGDGSVDNIFIIYAGQGEASYGPEDSVWPHSWNLASAAKTIYADGLRIDKYGCSNEWKRTSPDGVGTFIHEFSHVMGLPDLYSTNYGASSTETPGAYSVLDYGPYNNDGRTPPAYSAYERNAMGWLEPLVLGTEPLTAGLRHIETSGEAALIPTKASGEFFLVENRCKDGWDSYLPGFGMLVWHIDYHRDIFDANRVNNTAGHQYVDIVEACGRADNKNEALMQAYTFPGSLGITELSAESSPALSMWDGSSCGISLSEITSDPEQGMVYFNVNGGEARLDTPLALEADDITPEGFTAQWQAVDGASDYQLRVVAVSPGVPDSQTADMGSEGDSYVTLPEGWSASSDGAYTIASNCASTPPSFKMNTLGAWIESREFAGDISSVSFAMLGIGVDGSTISVLGLGDDGWTDLGVVIPQNSRSTATIGDIPMGIRAIRLIYNRMRGNVSVDDITVSSGAREYVLPGYNYASTGGATSVTVPAVQGVTDYRYRVRAIDGMRRSAPSDEITLTLPSASADSPVADSPENSTETWYDIYGRALGDSRPAAPGIYIVRRGDKVRKQLLR